MTLYLVLLFVLLLLSGFFSSSETAFLSIERVRLEHALRERRPGATRVSTLLQRPSRLLSAILLGNNLVNTGAAAVGTIIAADLVSGGEAALFATLAITVALVIFGEVAPKTVALHHNFALARVYAPPLQIWSAFTRPIVAALDVLSRVILRLLGEQRIGAQAISLGELRTAILLGTESGALGEDASDMLLGALSLEQQAARRIMVHRVNMVTAEVSETVADASARMAEHGYLRLPVFAGNADNMVGYVHVSDVNAAYQAGDTTRPLGAIMREPVFESELASIARVLERMQEAGTYLAILVDEFGATAGLVTLEDVMEVVVGELPSESGREQGVEDVQIGRRLVVEGVRQLAELGEELGAHLEHPEAETVGGLVLAYLRHFPQAGEVVEHAGYRFTVMGADERRVTLVAVEPLEGAVPGVSNEGPST
ncbi:MAG: hemolysin family protein [Dehalococcoidia bacterium]